MNDFHQENNKEINDKARKDAEELARELKEKNARRKAELLQKFGDKKSLYAIRKTLLLLISAIAKKQEEIKGEFYKSTEFKFVTQFLKVYGSNRNKNDVLKLQMLLRNRKWNFSLNQLQLLLAEVEETQRYEEIRSKILRHNPEKRREFIESYLNNYASDNERTLKIFAKILRERNLFVENISELRKEIKEVEEEIEADQFEKFLFMRSEQNLLEDIDQFNGYEFEEFLKELFVKMGYRVEQTKLSGDQGADLVVVKFGEKTVVQAKRFAGRVGNYAVQEITAAISFYEAQKGVVITNNYFTTAAIELAKANNIELIDRNMLEELINKYW